MLTPIKSLKLVRACLGVHARAGLQARPEHRPPTPLAVACAAEVRPSSARPLEEIDAFVSGK